MRRELPKLLKYYNSIGDTRSAQIVQDEINRLNAEESELPEDATKEQAEAWRQSQISGEPAKEFREKWDEFYNQRVEPEETNQDEELIREAQKQRDEERFKQIQEKFNQNVLEEEEQAKLNRQPASRYGKAVIMNPFNLSKIKP